MTIDERKQFDEILCNEANVKQLIRDFGATDESGNRIQLVFNAEIGHYFWKLGAFRVGDASDKTVLNILGK